jgi:hypothetical protein
MTPIDDLVREFLERFAEEKKKAEEERLERVRELRSEVREKLYAGDVSDHVKGCERCLFAILSLSKIECPDAQRHVPSKWLEYGVSGLTLVDS